MENIIKFLPRDAVAFLRIADSDARFPIRPISEGSFLIGHGTACDLRLGDHEVPALHSILRVTSTSASIALMAERPELVVNGEAVSRAVLCDGDLVEIGDVRLVFRFVSDKAQSGSARALSTVSDEFETAVDVASSTELSATELVSGLEHEFRLLNELQETTVDSIDRLLNAARRSVEGASIKLAPPPLRVVGIDERFLASDREQLQEIATKVKQQESRLSGVCHVLEQVVAQQQIMTTALQSVADRLTEVRAAIQTETASTRRASA
ncbi:MAG: FHA domain-containing protein [Planctomycetaceae bacterium]